MGRFDDSGMHEGYVVGYVPRGWTPTAAATALHSTRPVAVLEYYRASSVLRDLGLLDADHEHEVHGVYVVGYGCSCGWRSPYRELGEPLEWTPSSVSWPDWLEDTLARKWWLPHVRGEARRAEQVNHGHHTNDVVHLAIDLPRRAAIHMLVFLKALRSNDFDRIVERSAIAGADSANLGLLQLKQELHALLQDGGSNA